MEYCKTLNRAVLNRCQRCPWSYETDDSEFPSRFLFDLAYQIRDGQIILRAIDPRAVVTRDSRGRPLFAHQFSDLERPDVWLWFHARFAHQPDRLLQQMGTEIELDRQQRSESTTAIFQELTAELSGI